MRRCTWTFAVVLATVTLGHTVGAEPDGNDKTFARGVAALERGAYGEAIAELEQLADRGFVHPDASYNRAAAYVQRARSAQARPGDLGRAAAALSEALLLRPDDDGARAALRSVRNEIARRRSREGAEPVIVRPTMDRALVGLLSEDAWALGAAIGSVALTIGLAIRRVAKQSGARIGGGVATFVGLVLLVLCGALAASARHLRLTTEPAVVVVAEARILDETGLPVVQKDGVPEYTSIPEGAEVELHVKRGRLARFRWGSIEGWVTSSQLRTLATP